MLKSMSIDVMEQQLLAPQKPLLRGMSHLVSFFVALVGGGVLIALAPNALARWGALAFVATLALSFGVSALYHRPHWQPSARKWMRRLDHAAIFVLIAGTTTPVALSLASPSRERLLAVIWAGAGLGVVRAVFWVEAPKVLVALLALLLGWTTAPFMKELAITLGTPTALLIAAGGILYSFGAVVYARKRPDPWPKVFGYHELFHAFTVAAAAIHFVAVARITSSLIH
jgi:hemolysin III